MDRSMVIKKKWRIKTIYEKTENIFWGEYKKHEIAIEGVLVGQDSTMGKRYAIAVLNTENGIYAYDGYWGDSYNTIDEAIEEALRGSKLI